MGSFLSSILAGANPTLGGDINQAGQISGFGTSVGEGDIGAASGFYNDLLSGNQATQEKLLAPQISGIQKQAQQKTQTNAQFGNRSGGTNASNQTTLDTARSNVNDLVSKLTSGAASGLASLGTSALNTGLNANQVQANESQQQLENFQNSVLGKGISTAAGSLEGAGLDSLSAPGSSGAGTVSDPGIAAYSAAGDTWGQGAEPGFTNWGGVGGDTSFADSMGIE